MENRNVDILILGAGCAGLTAGIYAARSGKKTVILERNLVGGQAALTARVDNYPGVPEAEGAALMQSMAEQARSFGAEIVSCDVHSVDPAGRCAQTNLGQFIGRAMILAVGAEPRKLGIPGEAELTGRGVSYCASCDGFFFRDREIYVVGGGNSAGEEALHLAQIGSRVHMLVRRDSLRCDAVIRERIAKEPKLEVRYHCEVAEIRGKDRVEELLLRDARTGAVTQEAAPGCGVFIFVGYRPATELLHGKLALDAEGCIVTDGHLRTRLPGVYAAGDARQGALRQMITAAADGALAAAEAAKGL